jgi:site-specific DNA-methyltransferase (cytosine-N4-specific)
MSLYQERLILRLIDEAGYCLNQKLYWENPAKLPAPAEWVTVRRIRVTPSVENLWWLGVNAKATKANNAAVLRPYSESMKQKLRAGGERKAQQRPSGYTLKAAAFSEDKGGSIPHNIIVAGNTTSNDEYQRSCREAGLPIHPARYADAVPDFCIKFLTDPGDHVVDIFGGSGKTGKVAEALKRRWTVIEKSLKYACGGVFNFGEDALRSVDEDLFAAAFAR